MSLENLIPAAGSNQKQGKRLGRGEGSGKGGHQQEVTKEPSPDLDIQKRLALRAVRCRCKDVFPNLIQKHQ